MIVYEPFRMTPLADFHDELIFEFPRLPSQLLDYYLVRTAITMARRGNLIRRVALLDAQPGVTRYRLEAPDGLDIVGVMDIRKVNRCGMDAEVTRAFTVPADSCSCKRDVAWFDDAEKVLHVDGSYCPGSFHISLAVAPSRDACALPEQYMTDFFPTLMMGVKGALMLIVGRPWTNLRVGQACTEEFLKMLANDSLDVATHKQRGGVKMQFGRVL